MKHAWALLLLATPLATARPLQQRLPRGGYSTMAQAVSLANDVPDPIYIKPAGDTGVLPTVAQSPVAATNIPDYTLAALFPNWDEPEEVEIDAFSTGNDRLMVDAAGVVQTTNNDPFWATMLFSVSRTSKGDPGTPLRRRYNDSPTNEAGADIFSHYFSASSVIAPVLAGSDWFEIGAEHMGLNGASEIDGLDFALPLLRVGGNVPGGVLFLQANEFYFSVTKSFAKNHPGFFPPGVQASGASIYRTTWNGTSWSPIMEQYSPQALGLLLDDPSTPEVDEAEDIDALAVDQPQSLVVFSTVRASSPANRRQLLVHSAGNTRPLQETTPPGGTGSNGDPLRIDDEDDVDAITTLDPEGDRGSSWLPTPIVVPEKSMVLSWARWRQGSQWELVMAVDGWRPGALPTSGWLNWQVASDVTPVFDTFARTYRPSTADHYEQRFQVGPPATAPNGKAALRALMNSTQSWWQMLGY